jgi:hypothetical protein
MPKKKSSKKSKKGQVSSSYQHSHHAPDLLSSQHHLALVPIALLLQASSSLAHAGSSSTSRQTEPSFTSAPSPALRSLYEDVIMHTCAQDLRSTYGSLPEAAQQKCIQALREAVMMHYMDLLMENTLQQARPSACPPLGGCSFLTLQGFATLAFPFLQMPTHECGIHLQHMPVPSLPTLPTVATFWVFSARLPCRIQSLIFRHSCIGTS